MAFKTAFIGKSKHFVIDAGGITNTENGNTPVHQFLANPVYSHIALCANHYLIFPVKGLVNGFYQCGSLTGSGRTVDYSNIFGMHHFIYCFLLRIV